MGCNGVFVTQTRFPDVFFLKPTPSFALQDHSYIEVILIDISVIYVAFHVNKYEFINHMNVEQTPAGESSISVSAEAALERNG